METKEKTIKRLSGEDFKNVNNFDLLEALTNAQNDFTLASSLIYHAEKNLFTPFDNKNIEEEKESRIRQNQEERTEAWYKIQDIKFEIIKRLNK